MKGCIIDLQPLHMIYNYSFILFIHLKLIEHNPIDISLNIDLNTNFVPNSTLHCIRKFSNASFQLLNPIYN